MSVLTNLLALCFAYHIQECLSHYVMYTTDRMRIKLFAMDRELLKDSMQKIKSIQHMRSFYSRSPSYFIAERIFMLRRKFARMMRLYTMAHKNIEEPYHLHLKFMEEIQHLSMDIDHLVEMLVEWESGPRSKLIKIGDFFIPADVFRSDNLAKFGGMPKNHNIPPELQGMIGKYGKPGLGPPIPGGGGRPGHGGKPVGNRMIGRMPKAIDTNVNAAKPFGVARMPSWYDERRRYRS